MEIEARSVIEGGSAEGKHDTGQQNTYRKLELSECKVKALSLGTQEPYLIELARTLENAKKM
jgi:hypothetical protein